MFAPVTHILPLTLIRRERVLPVSGRVVVRKGQKISATDVIAEARLAPEHMLLDIARGLGLTRDQSDQHIQCKAGTSVVQGDVLAGPVGFTQRVVRAPRNGKVIVAGEGQVLLELDAPPYELRAGMPGVVADLVSDRGAVVEVTGALVQGVWGNGRIDFGLMYVLAKSPDDVLTPDQLDVSMRGSVVLAAHCKAQEVFKAAAELPLRGMILGSMDSSLFPLALKMRFPIVVLDGFGHIPMNSAAYKLLTSSNRREVALNAEQRDRYREARPEVVIELPAPDHVAPPREADVFSPNQPVRLLRAPYVGKIGILIQVRPGRSALPNGILAQAADVRLESGETVLVPLANLEVLA